MGQRHADAPTGGGARGEEVITRAAPATLPFTGLALVLLLAGGAALAVGGFALRAALAADWATAAALGRSKPGA